MYTRDVNTFSYPGQPIAIAGPERPKSACKRTDTGNDAVACIDELDGPI
jgi:hypothetical protein